MILIIDDDKAIRLSLGLLFKQAGFDTAEACTQREALEFVRQNEPELIVLDMNLTLTTTGRDGIELLRKIKIFSPEVPVILISAWGTIPLAVEGMSYGACDFITKPWSNRDLLAKARKAISGAGNKSEEQVAPTLEDLERRAIKESLLQNNYNLSQTAEELGITRQSLYRRMQKYNIK